MTVISKKQALDLTELLVIGAVTTAGLFISGPLGASVMAGIGINLASNIIHGNTSKIKDRWLTSTNGILNHDIQKALLRSYIKALSSIEIEYFRIYNELQENEKETQGAIKYFFKQLSKRAETSFFPSIENAIRHAEINEYLFNNTRSADDLLWERIDAAKLLDSYNQHFVKFFRESLLNEVKFYFGEELKTDSLECNKAWRAFQRLLLEGIKEEIKSLSIGQENIRSELKKLERIENKIIKLSNILNNREPNEPFQANLNDIQSSIRNIAAITSRTEKNIEALRYYIENENFHIQTLIENSQIRNIDIILSIPTPPEVLIGRENLIKSIIEKINQGKSVSLHGMAGIGKTSLSSYIASLFQKNGEKVLWLKAGHNNCNYLCNEIARRFEEQTIINLNLEDKYEKIRTLLFRFKITLIVLDDVWDISAVRDFFKQTIPSGCRAIITGRKRVGLGYAYDILPLEQNDSEKLFRHHSNVSENINVRNICNLLGEHPMAIEIAGKALWINSFTVKDFEERLLDSTNKLKTLSLSNATHENMWATLLTSYKTLRKDEQKVFCAFGSLWNTSTTAEMISMISEYKQSDITKILQSLISNSLVKFETTIDNITIYRMHDLTFDFAYTLVKSKKTDLHRNALKSCVSYSKKYSGQDRKDHNYLEAEKTNLLLSALYAFNNSYFDEVNELALSLYEKGEYLRWRGYVIESIVLLENAVISSEKLNNPIDKGIHLGNLGISYRQIGKIEKSIEYHKKALDVMVFNKNKEGESDALGEIGWAYHRLGNTKESIRYLKRALNISKDIGDRRWESIWLGTLGRVYKDIGKIKEAIDCHQVAFQIMVDIGNERGQGARIGELGWDYESIQEYEKAINCYEKALDIAQSISDVRREGVWFASIGSVFIKLKNFEASEAFLNKALKIAKKIGHRTNEANIYLYFGELYYSKCKYDESQVFVLLSLNIYKETHQKREIAKCWHLLGLNYKSQLLDGAKFDRYLFDEAKNAFNEALKIKNEINDVTLIDTINQIDDLKLTNFRI